MKNQAIERVVDICCAGCRKVGGMRWPGWLRSEGTEYDVRFALIGLTCLLILAAVALNRRNLTLAERKLEARTGDLQAQIDALYHRVAVLLAKNPK